jgi:hypothetical protein
MTKSIGFWSYVHEDDNAEKGRISQLVQDISEQYQMLTGESISIYLDTEENKWGEKWRENIDTALSEVVFFIPVITPRYIQSTECRREIQYFVQGAEKLGLHDLILPLLYVDFKEFHNKETSDELIKLINEFQWVDWTETRFLECTSEGYRRGVNKLAQRLVESNIMIESDISENDQLRVECKKETDVIEEPGLIDSLAETEEALPKVSEIMENITKQTNVIQSLMEKATEDINKSENSGAGFGPRLMISKRLAKELESPVNSIWESCNEYSVQIYKIDSGIRVLIEQAPKEKLAHPDSVNNFSELFSSINEFHSATDYAFSKTEEFVEISEQLGNLSRDLRPVLRRLKLGLQVMVDTKKIIENWVNLIDQNIKIE